MHRFGTFSKIILLSFVIGCGARQVDIPDSGEEHRHKDAWTRMDLNGGMDGNSLVDDSGGGDYHQGGEDIIYDQSSTQDQYVDVIYHDTAVDIHDTHKTDTGKDSTSDSGTYEGIYQGLEHTTGKDLWDALHRIVSSHHHGLSYKEASYQVKTYVDEYNGYVTGVYTGVKYPPHEANSKFNIEHTWPQSKGAKSLPAKSDMHHLYPTNPRANSSRGNLPFGVVVDSSATFGDSDCNDHFPQHPEGCLSYLGYDRDHKKVFEPRDAHKGNVARAIFYFCIRYNLSLTRLDTYSTSHARKTEAVLKEWNKEDPPDEEEMQRNDRIYRLQGNRNPFIDHPEFVDRLEFVRY